MHAIRGVAIICPVFTAPAPLAQLDRASDYGSEGWRFKSSEARHSQNAGLSSQVARQAHNLKVVGSNPTPATNLDTSYGISCKAFFVWWRVHRPQDWVCGRGRTYLSPPRDFLRDSASHLKMHAIPMGDAVHPDTTPAVWGKLFVPGQYNYVRGRFTYRNKWMNQ